MDGLPRATRVGTIVLVIATAMAFGLAFAADGWSLSGHDLGVALLLGAMFTLAEVFNISFPHSTGAFYVSVGSPIALAAGFTLGPFIGGAVVMIAIVIESIHARRSPVKAVVNVALFGLVTVLSTVVYDRLADPGATQLGSLRNMGAVVVAGIVFTLVNAAVLSVIVAPIVGVHPVRMLRTNLSGIYVQMLTLPTFGALVPILAREHPLALLVIVVPLVGPFLSFKAFEKTREETLETMAGLADALERRDPYTHQHSMRVTGYVQAILAEIPGVPYETAQGILAAARIHDIGKVAVSDLVLNKPDGLTAAEFVQIQAHAAVGAEMVERLWVYRPWVPVIRHHHERWDGRGYPDGLAGEAIPLGARIIAVADTFDAMTTDRVYRKAFDRATALRELRDQSGIQFDPEIVAAMDRSLNPPPPPPPQAAPAPPPIVAVVGPLSRRRRPAHRAAGRGMSAALASPRVLVAVPFRRAGRRRASGPAGSAPARPLGSPAGRAPRRRPCQAPPGAAPRAPQ